MVIEERPKLHIVSTHPWIRTLRLSALVLGAFDNLITAIQFTNARVQEGRPWQEVEFVLQWIDPIMHRILGIEAEVISPGNESRIINEACRLGIFLFLAEVRRKCSIQGVSSPLYVSKLRRLIEQRQESVNWDRLSYLLLWILFFGFLESREDEDIDWYAKTICEVTGESGVESWHRVMAAAKRFLWFNDVFESHGERLRGVLVSRSVNALFLK